MTTATASNPTTAPRGNRGRPKGSTADTVGDLLRAPSSGRRIAMMVYQERALSAAPLRRGALATAMRKVADDTDTPFNRVKRYVQLYPETQALGEMLARAVKANAYWASRVANIERAGRELENRISGFMEHHKKALLDLPVSKVSRLLRHPSITPGAGAPVWLAECLNDRGDIEGKELIARLEAAAKLHR